MEKATKAKEAKPKLVGKILAKLDLDSLADTLVESLSENLLNTINTDTLAEQVMAKYADTLQTALIEGIMQRM